MKGVQCHELFGGIALKIHTFSLLLVVISAELPKPLVDKRQDEELFP